ncbi:MAG: thioredoxin domain-containing protein [bacterium]|nr:thioredoxin domain-containing protein [bacterium]
MSTPEQQGPGTEGQQPEPQEGEVVVPTVASSSGNEQVAPVAGTPPTPVRYAAPAAQNSKLVPILASIIALLVGIGGGYIIGRDSANREHARLAEAAEQATQPVPPAAPAPAPTAPAAPATPQGAPTEAPTPTEEQMQQILEARRAVPTRSADDPLAVGEVDAPVVMVEFADFRCGYCGRFALETLPELMPLVEEGTLRIEFRDFPIFQEESVDAAVAARAAANQGRYLEFAHEVYNYQFAEGGSDLSQEMFVTLAGQAGVADIEQFTADLADPELRAAVDASYQDAMEILGRPSTPQFVINDEYIGGAETTENFLMVIQQELAKVS